MGIGAAILGAGAIAGTAGVGASIIGSNAQENAARTAASNQMSIYQQNQQLLNPYVQQGLGAYSTLNNLLGVGGTGSMQTAGTTGGGQPAAPPSISFGGGPSQTGAGANLIAGLYGSQLGGTPSGTPGTASTQGGSNLDSIYNTLNNLPGYQFTLGQGLKSVQNSYAARGLGASGGALKGAANYATGLAQSNYGSYVNQLQAAAGLGEGAGAAIAGVGQATGQGIANANIAGGNAAAAGALGVGNSIGNAVNGLPGNLLLGSYLAKSGGFGSLFGGGGGQTTAPEFGYT